MCGVVAMLSRDGPVSAEALDRAVARLHHRGPDGRQCWLATQGGIGLGHARLSIIDLETGAQPIANEDARIRIVVNGEFYDYERIRRDLLRGGHRFRTQSDSEIALHLYEDLGLGCLQHLRGEFAFVIWDETRDRLIAARDRYGIKPLYYSLHGGCLYVASEMKALFAAGVPARWDAQSVYLGQALRGPQRTPFENVFAVPPGHYLLAERDGLELVQYWDVDYPREEEELPYRSEADLVRGFRAVLEEAVRLRLRADVPVACYLSGGLDSCAILGLAARHRSDPIQTYTIGFEHEDYDERGIAREMAALAGAAFTPIALRQDDLADNFSDAVFYSEGVCANAHGIAKYLLSRAVRDAGFKVVLTGEGADEVLAGYPHLRVDNLLHQSAERGREETLRLLTELGETNAVSMGLMFPGPGARGSSLMQRRLGFIPTWLWPHFTRLTYMRGVCPPDYLEAFVGRDPAAFLLGNLDIEGRLQGRHPVDQALYLWAKTMLPNYILATLGDRMEMAHSIEGRLPFLDHAVGEFLQRTPLDLKIRGVTEKYILREATRDLVTEAVYRRQKHPFLSPPLALTSGGRLIELVRDTLCSEAAAAVPFLKTENLRRLADSLPTRTPDELLAIDGQLMVLVSTIFLHQRMGVEG
ncbi:asparagine synthase (glutamine-hydrolyzing) [Pelagibius sp.]|uniref:asparagine synthase (glutamine-hydrolyzing) n=1 Tax=Pelagibius sp. TaxID=1931238 RepID=UPI00261C7E5E|nr:asparagine synthase (glutamine-hydrolyzing) [Pelagibius sp.]